ncbi:MAG: VPLPA-CTERM sorting domain-containing protein [Pseudomonadota bacterium]
MKNIRMVLAALLMAFSTATFASTMTFTVGDHEDGVLYDGATNPYGVRVDDTGQLFSTGDNLPGAFGGASVTLSFDPTDLAAGAVLIGTVIDNATGTAWEIDYVLSDLSAAANGGFIAQMGVGTLTEIGGSGMIDLIGESNGTGVFVFDNDGFRLGASDGWVGRGWFAGSGSANDILIVATPVPLPGAIWMMGAALLGLTGLRRRQ